MKKKFILAIFGISLLFMACQEDSYYNDYDMGGKNSSILTEAMKLVDDNYTNVTLPDLGKTLGRNTTTRGLGGKKYSMSLDDEAFTFDWSNAEIISSSKAEAVIVPVKQNRGVALQSVVAKGNVSREETTPLYSILYVRKFLDDGKSYAHILSFAPDRDYANTCEERGEEMQLYPNPQGSNYSGILFVSTIYGEISHGIRYENGRMCHYILPRSERNRDFIEKYRSGHAECHEHCDSTHMHTRMSMNFITFNSATRSTYSIQSENGSGYNCSICGKDVYDCTCVEIVACGVCKQDPCVCYDDIEQEEEERCVYCGFQKEYCHCYNDSWQDDYGNSHGPNPGNPYPNNPGHNSGGNSGNDGNTNESTAINENLSKITNAELVKLDSEDVAILNDVIDQLIKKSDSHSKLFDWLVAGKIKITFQLGEINTPAQFYRNTITFKNSQDITCNSLIEELVHAVQYNCCYNKDMNNTYSDYELEAKMVCDILCGETEEACGSMTLLNMYPDGREMYASQFVLWCRSGDYSNYMYYYNAFKPYFDYNMEDTIPSVFKNTPPKVLEELYGNKK